MMKLRNRSYVKYSTYALIAAFMVSMTPAGAMADLKVGDSFSQTGDVKITGTLDASEATKVKLGTTVATKLLVGPVSGAEINVGEELNKLGDVLGTDYKNPTFSTLTATGDTTLGATTADSLTIGGNRHRRQLSPQTLATSLRSERIPILLEQTSIHSEPMSTTTRQTSPRTRRR